MPFKLVLMAEADPHWPEMIQQAVPGCEVVIYQRPEDLDDADAAFGTVPPEVFGRAKQLKWIQASRAGLGRSWFYDELVDSDVVVTGVHGSYNEHLSQHAVGFLLAFARRLDRYVPRMPEGSWSRDWPMIDLDGSVVAIVGVGGSGAEAGRLCAELGMRVIGFDPRRNEAPEGFEVLYPAETLDEHLPGADFVIVTAPETPQTTGMFNAERFARMKRGAYLINISRGVLIVADDLVEALRSGQLAGAGLDVADPEPLPSDHPLWTMPGVMITPHVAIYGGSYRERWLELLIENCRRFEAGEPMINLVDKRSWF